VRGEGRTAEVLVVHRPAYGDWTFPKGKVERGETDEDCAVREVEEETGLRCTLGRELPSTEYVDGKGRQKSVRYWQMEVVGGSLRFDNEVDAGLWVSPAQANELLSYERDAGLLRAVLA
jgi:8-oxo-dGTP pyrophosphatase MutT (NUDIX family)